MAGVNKCIKYSMFFFNFLFWLCGSIILGISIWLRVSKSAEKWKHSHRGNVRNAVINWYTLLPIAGVNIAEFYPAINLLITVGSIIMVLGFLGCCGAIKESKCMLILFFIGLLLILVLQITAGILGTLYSSEVETVVNDTYKDYIPLSDQPLEIKEEIDELQQESKCCGLLNGYKDWGNSIPSSCDCKPDQNNHCVTANGKSVWAQSCVNVMNDILKASCVIIIGIAFGLAVIEILGLAFSMTLYCQIKNK